MKNLDQIKNDIYEHIKEYISMDGVSDGFGNTYYYNINDDMLELYDNYRCIFTFDEFKNIYLEMKITKKSKLEEARAKISNIKLNTVESKIVELYEEAIKEIMEDKNE